MPKSLSAPVRMVLLFLLVFPCFQARATHIIGGELTYKYIDSEAAGYRYRVTLAIYEDCLNGTAAGIAGDDPGYIAVYDGHGNLFHYDSAYHSVADTVPANFNIECVKNPPELCMIKKTFVIDFVLPADSTGYTVAYKRCCHNGALVNILHPVDVGSTFFCNIPPIQTAKTNNSAVFTFFPPQIICAHTPLLYNNSAIDPDGDSLSYELCTSYNSDNSPTANAWPPAPPYEPTAYVHPPYSYYNPLTGSPALAIDPVTGMLTATPSWEGRYLITVCCNEWRNGVLINTIHREFQFVVTDCSKSVIADMPTLPADPNTTVLNCKDYVVHFQNTSIGGVTWHWDFGVATTLADTSTDFEPTFAYPDTGTFTVKLIANPGTLCADSIEKLVKIYPPFNAAFSDSGLHCPGEAIGFIDKSTGTISAVNNWYWNFGDGQTSTSQNNVHTYLTSGIYNVSLISANLKSCVDTIMRQVVIENVKPGATLDTIIVKGQSILFHAEGGINYVWSPANNLDDNKIPNPVGFYPESGLFRYTIAIKSSYGCTIEDTVSVLVVNQQDLFVPTSFSPNGDGKNDIFRPITAGYKSVHYFMVFDRWGEKVFDGKNLNDGWDGMYKGQKAQMGTYYWQLSFDDINGKTKALSGDVTLLR